MKATFDLDSELYRRLKIAAAVKGKKIREMVEEGISIVLDDSDQGGQDQSSPLPVVRRKTGKTLPVYSNQDLETLLVEEDHGRN